MDGPGVRAADQPATRCFPRSLTTSVKLDDDDDIAVLRRRGDDETRREDERTRLSCKRFLPSPASSPPFLFVNPSLYPLTGSKPTGRNSSDFVATHSLAECRRRRRERARGRTK